MYVVVNVVRASGGMVVAGVSTSGDIGEVNAEGPGVVVGGNGIMVLLGVATDGCWVEGVAPGNVADSGPAWIGTLPGSCWIKLTASS